MSRFSETLRAFFAIFRRERMSPEFKREAEEMQRWQFQQKRRRYERTISGEDGA